MQMLKTSKEFDFVYKNSYKFRSEVLDICVLRANMAGQFYEKFRRLPCNLIGFSVSKKVGNAVERNLVKRRLRAICREFFGVGNSPLGLHSADFGIFGDFADLYPVSAPKIPKNHESQTENPSVVDSALSAESSKKNSSLRDSAKQNRGNPPYKKNTELQCGLPRRFCESARNDESFLDSADSQNLAIKNNRTNLICIFIAKSQILQTPFITLKNNIFATLKRQLNFRQGLHKKPNRPHSAQNSINKNHAKGTL